MARKLDKRNSLKVVVQNSFIKARTSQGMDVNAQKILRLAIAQCKMTDNQLYEYTASGTEIAEIFNVSQQNVYQYIDKWTSQCMGTVMEFKKTNEKSFKKYPLFNCCEYEKGILRMQLHEKMPPFVLNIKQELGFTQYELSNIITVKGKYTIRIYEMIMMQMKSRKAYANNTVEIELDLAELRVQTSTEKCYKQIGQFKDRVLNRAVAEIEKSMGWKIEIEDIKTGRTITGFHLKIWSKVGFDYAKSVHVRELTNEERKEYDRLTTDAEQMDINEFMKTIQEDGQ